MHPVSTHNEFLRLRVQGLSLASISRRLHVSKPTLIKWNCQSQSEIDFQKAADQQCVSQEVTTSANKGLADLTRRLSALKQELFSRAMHEIPTAALETISGDLRKRIECLQSTSNGSSAAGLPALGLPSEGGLVAPKLPSEGGSAAILQDSTAPNPSAVPVPLPSLHQLGRGQGEGAPHSGFQNSTTPSLQSPAIELNRT